MSISIHSINKQGGKMGLASGYTLNEAIVKASEFAMKKSRTQYVAIQVYDGNTLVHSVGVCG